MHPDNDRVIQQTENWISQVVIGLSLCPFAQRAFDEKKITYSVVDKSSSSSEHLKQLADCLSVLDSDYSIETSLIIYPDAYQQFDDYLELLHLTNLLIEDLKYQGIYQLASFHPDYRFEGNTEDDASNFTNRSPYPMLHILREESIEHAIKNHQNIEGVPENNIKKCREFGYDTMQHYLDKCRQEP